MRFQSINRRELKIVAVFLFGFACVTFFAGLFMRQTDSIRYNGVLLYPGDSGFDAAISGGVRSFMIWAGIMMILSLFCFTRGFLNRRKKKEA